MSKNAKKFQKPQASKHNSRCTQTPSKERYRDMKVAIKLLGDSLA